MVDYPLPQAVDANGQPLTVRCAPAPGSPFTSLTFVVTCTATDAAGQQTTRTFTVVVAHSGAGRPPQFGVLPGTQPGQALTEQRFVVPAGTAAVVFVPPTATDFLGQPLAVRCVNTETGQPVDASTPLLVRDLVTVTTITCTATDALGQTASIVIRVVIVVVAPEVAPPAGPAGADPFFVR